MPNLGTESRVLVQYRTPAFSAALNQHLHSHPKLLKYSLLKIVGTRPSRSNLQRVGALLTSLSPDLQRALFLHLQRALPPASITPLLE